MKNIYQCAEILNLLSYLLQFSNMKCNRYFHEKVFNHINTLTKSVLSIIKVRPQLQTRRKPRTFTQRVLLFIAIRIGFRRV